MARTFDALQKAEKAISAQAQAHAEVRRMFDSPPVIKQKPPAPKRLPVRRKNITA